MPIDAFSDDLDSLRELVAQLSTERDAALAECKRVMEQNDRLRHLLQQLRRAQFGRKSERLDPEQLQLAIEDLETAVAAEDAEQDKTAPIEEAPKKKRKTNRGSLPAHLPRVHITLAPDSTACPCCQGVMHVIGEETAERLDKIPAQYQVIVTHRPKYGCRACEGAIVQAPAQERLIKGGIPTENLVADVVVDKYAWHKPLYRQAQIMRLQGLPVDRSTLAGWVGAAAAEIKPVYLRMKEIVLASAKIVVDETRAPVLDPGRGRTKTGYFWAISRDDRPWGGLDPPAVVYTYAPGRGAKHATALLAAIPASFIATDTRSISSWPIRSATAVQRRWPFAGRTGVADLSRSTRAARHRSRMRRWSGLQRCTRSRIGSAVAVPMNAALSVRRRPGRSSRR